MYHVNPKMLGTTPDWQYPQMLAKHAAGRLGLAAGTLVFVCQVGGWCPCGGGVFREGLGARPCREPRPWKEGQQLRVGRHECLRWRGAHHARSQPLLLLQWLERALDVVGIVASFLNVYVTKVRSQRACLGLPACLWHAADAPLCCMQCPAREGSLVLLQKHAIELPGGLCCRSM